MTNEERRELCFDLQGVVTSITGHIYLAQDEPEDATHLTKALEQTQRASRMIRELVKEYSQEPTSLPYPHTCGTGGAEAVPCPACRWMEHQKNSRCECTDCAEGWKILAEQAAKTKGTS